MTKTENIRVADFVMNKYVTKVEPSRVDKLTKLKYGIFADRGAVLSKQNLLLFSQDIH